MKVEVRNPVSGEFIREEVLGVGASFVEMIADLDFSDEKLKRLIERLEYSADAKSLLFSLAKITVKIGKTIVQVGRKVLDIVFKLIEEFPKATMGLLLGVVFGHVIAPLSILGVAFSGVLASLAMAFGFTVGVLADISDSMLLRRIKRMQQEFSLAG